MSFEGKWFKKFSNMGLPRTTSSSTHLNPWYARDDWASSPSPRKMDELLNIAVRITVWFGYQMMMMMNVLYIFTHIRMELRVKERLYTSWNFSIFWLGSVMHITWIAGCVQRYRQNEHRMRCALAKAAVYSIFTVWLAMDVGYYNFPIPKRF